MWGNRLGWSISAVIAVVFGVALVMYARIANTRSAPTPFAAAARANEPLQLSDAPQSVVPGMKEPTDAAPFYRRAIDAYHAKKREYDTFAERGKPGTSEAESLVAIAQLLDAAPCASMNLFGAKPEAIVRYGAVNDLEALRVLGQIAAVRFGLVLEKSEKPDDAMTYYEAVFSLGAKLFAERVTYPEMELGLSLMGLVTQPMQRILKSKDETDRATAIERFEAGRRKLYNERVQPMARVLRSIDAGVVGQHAGDVFYFAESAKERMWRIEAILAMGRMRYFVGAGGTLGNQRGASQLIKQYANDPDPFIRHAAKVARELTIEQYRVLS